MIDVNVDPSTTLGGNEFRIPVPCIVDADAAFAVISEFVKSLQQSAAVPWVSYGDLPLPDELYADY